MASLKALLEELYPENYHDVVMALRHCWREKKPEAEKTSDWYKKIHLYVTYPDTFHLGDEADLGSLTKKLEYIKNLGCNAVHVLPFLASPMVDGGFDVSDSYLVRESLGGNVWLEKLLNQAKKNDISVFMDMILNHISEEHRWFRQAISGDSFYRNFFVNSLDEPDFVKTFVDEHGVWAKYKVEGKELDIRVIFPGQCGDIPHWRQADDGYWYYHTFYPQQLDLNWDNYHVFVAYAKVMAYWAKLGVSFRLDAIPFVGKDLKKGITESSPKTHLIAQALHKVIKKVNPDCVFLVEANQPIKGLVKYFGETEVESELAYGFGLMNGLWLALLSGKVESLWEAVDQMSMGPEWSGWITFLRNHDELSLEYVEVEDRKEMLEYLRGTGDEFREGFGYSGRSVNFLKEDLRRLVMAYFLLASMPGSPAIIYGDELGKGNDFEFMKLQTLYKRDHLGDDSIEDDTRDINRGWIGEGEILSERGHFVYVEMSKMYKRRLELPEIALGELKRVDSDTEGLLVGKYELEKGELMVLINLTNEEKVYQVEGVDRLEFEINYAKLESGKLVLPEYAGAWVRVC